MGPISTIALGLCVAVASVACVAGKGDERQQKNPQRAWDFKWASAKAAKTKFDRAEQKALSEFERALGAARDQLARELRGSLKDATRAENLDEAVKIRTAIDTLKEAKGSAPGSAALQRLVRQKLGGTRWRVGEVDLRFDGDTFYYSDWGDNRGTWEALSTQTLACHRDHVGDWRYTFDAEFKYVFCVDLNGRLVGQGVRLE